MAATKGINVLVQMGTTAATGTLTFSGGVSDGEIITIGGQVYEFDTDAQETITAGNVRVDVSGGATAPDAVTALVAAITNDPGAVVTAVDGALDTVVVTAKESGTGGNAIGTTKLCTNATWGDTVLGSGADTTLALQRNGNISLTAEAIDITTKADAVWKQFMAGHAEGEVTCDGLLSPNDASQEALMAAFTAQTPVTVKFTHNTTPTRYFWGKCIVTNLEQRAAHDGAAEYSATFKLSGSLSYVDA